MIAGGRGGGGNEGMVLATFEECWENTGHGCNVHGRLRECSGTQGGDDKLLDMCMECSGNTGDGGNVPGRFRACSGNTGCPRSKPSVALRDDEPLLHVAHECRAPR